MFPTLSNLVLHIINIVIIFVIIYLLAYKPVLKFIEKRNSALMDKKNDAEEQIKKAEEMKAEYQAILGGAEDIAEQKKLEMEAVARKSCEDMLAQARDEAGRVLKDANEKAEKERLSALHDAEKEIAEHAVKLAGEILKREVSKTDNEKIIDGFLEKAFEQVG